MLIDDALPAVDCQVIPVEENDDNEPMLVDEKYKRNMSRKNYFHTNLPIITNNNAYILNKNLMSGLETIKLNSCSSLSSSNNSSMKQPYLW
jgi:hypothetical protein